MHQVLHIFRKDSRQFWPEILATLVITMAYAWAYAFQWRSDPGPRILSSSPILDLHHLQILANVVTGLLPFAWFFLIARVIHAENLIGNRQFWLTRPYNWKSLLAEKFLFVGVYIYLPFLLAQFVLLTRAGFSPFHYIPGLSFLLLLFTGIIVIPFMSYAAVVSTVQRMLLILLGICAIIAAIAFLASSHESVPSMQTPFSDRLSIPIVILVGFAALVTQYSGRRLWLGRALLIILIPTVALIASNPLEQIMFDRTYAVLRSDDSNQIHAQLSSMTDDGVTASSGGKDSAATLHIPVELTGIPSNFEAHPDDISIAIDTADGAHLSVPWQAVYNEHFSTNRSEGTLDIQLSRADFDRIKKKPARITVSLAVTELKADDAVVIPYPETDEVAIKNFGRCQPTQPQKLQTFNEKGFSCRFALRQPTITHVSAPLASNPCGTGPAVVATQYASSWIGSEEPDPADFGLTSVWTGSVSFDGTAAYAFQGSQRYFVCPGTPITFTPFHVDRRFRIQFIIPTFQVPDIVAAPPLATTG